MYAKFFKRIIDFVVSLVALILLLPVFIILSAIGAIAMKGNPFFTQARPGKKGKEGNEKIFKLVKFRTMSNAKDKDGNLLPDEVRLNKYGKFLRSTSLDELPELWNILKGDMSIVGPRPLIERYLPYYTKEERKRHDVRPGLTGLAQVNGRSFITWEEIFAFDILYISSITFIGDVKIVLKTFFKVLKKEKIADVSESTIDEQGRHHFVIDGEEYILHRELDIERGANKEHVE